MIKTALPLTIDQAIAIRRLGFQVESNFALSKLGEASWEVNTDLATLDLSVAAGLEQSMEWSGAYVEWLAQGRDSGMLSEAQFDQMVMENTKLLEEVLAITSAAIAEQ